MRLDADKQCLICDYCGNVFVPEPNEDGVRVLGDTTELECPVCVNALVHGVMHRQGIVYCTRCRGMLIPMGAFYPLIQDLRSRREAHESLVHEPDWKSLDRRIKCPECKTQMDTHLYGGPGNVIIDDCEICGLVWLDHGELERIVIASDPPPMEENA
jgi:Zn-finger nucleic acid-binding protein